MPDSTTVWRTFRPTEGFSTAYLPDRPCRPIRLFVPTDHQPKYAYPLVVLLHAAGSDEDAAVRLAPLLSRRNYIIACPRGPVCLGGGRTGRVGYGWADRPDDFVTAVAAWVAAGHHIHPGRHYLVGIGEGASAALRTVAAAPGRFAGVAGLGDVPAELLTDLPGGTRVFLGHGADLSRSRVARLRAAVRLATARGLPVRLEAYPAPRPVATYLRELNRWIIRAIGPDTATIPGLLD
jgi:phospholipase/carboxylesterase